MDWVPGLLDLTIGTSPDIDPHIIGVSVVSGSTKQKPLDYRGRGANGFLFAYSFLLQKNTQP